MSPRIQRNREYKLLKVISHTRLTNKMLKVEYNFSAFLYLIDIRKYLFDDLF